MSKREKVTKFILKEISKIAPGSGNVEYYEKIFSGMSDSRFDTYIKSLKSGGDVLGLVIPNLSKSRINVQRNIKQARALGHEFFQKLYLTDPDTNVTYLTPIPYLVVDIPLRRQSQLLSKKASIPQNNNRTDELTGQYAGNPKGASISFPELQVLYAQGYDDVITELIKMRGGDEEAFREMNRMMIANGSVRLSAIKSNGRVKSTDTLGTLLSTMHIGNNI